MPRVTPSKEQIKYLKSIGVLPDSGDTKHPVATAPPSLRKRTPTILLAIFAVIAVLLLLYAVVHAQEENAGAVLRARPFESHKGQKRIHPETAAARTSWSCHRGHC